MLLTAKLDPEQVKEALELYMEKQLGRPINASEMLVITDEGKKALGTLFIEFTSENG